jgi:alkanesulfonate monooxygenase
MPVHFIGMISTQPKSEIHLAAGPAIDRDYVKLFAQAHEEGGFDRILVPYHSHDADTLLVAAYAAAHTDRIGFMLAHRPGFVAPTLAARKFATLDQFTGGRVAVHVISGGDDAEQQRDGDFLSHDERYARTDEYVDVLRRTWTSDKPFDHEGRFYRFRDAYSEVKPVQKPHIPIYFGGSSDIAIEVAGRHADIYALWGETVEQTRETIARVRASAVRAGRDPSTIAFSLSLRPILADTEAAAWLRAEDIVATIKRIKGQAPLGAPTKTPSNVGSQRLLEAASQGRVVDKRLWTEVAALTGARGNTTALVGTPDQVTDSLLDYWDAGISTFLIRGFDPLDDAVEYGRSLLPRVRAAVAAREGSRSRIAAAG